MLTRASSIENYLNIHQNGYSNIILAILSSLCCGVCRLPEYCYNYYSEFALDEHYNPGIYPEVNTTLTDITTLYKVSEVVSSHNKIYFALILIEDQMSEYFKCDHDYF